jgi:hypothetical protein
MRISKSKLIQVIKEELTAVLTEEAADERDGNDIDSLWRYARQNRRALNKLLKEAGHDELEGERPDTDEKAGGLGDSTSGVSHRGYEERRRAGEIDLGSVGSDGQRRYGQRATQQSSYDRDEMRSKANRGSRYGMR